MKEVIPFLVLSQQFFKFFRYGQAILALIPPEADLDLLPDPEMKGLPQLLVDGDDECFIAVGNEGTLALFRSIQGAENASRANPGHRLGDRLRNAYVSAPESVVRLFQFGVKRQCLVQVLSVLPRNMWRRSPGT